LFFKELDPSFHLDNPSVIGSKADDSKRSSKGRYNSDAVADAKGTSEYSAQSKQGSKRDYNYDSDAQVMKF
jgi:hypothetical protein